jgi:hypothetical protein
MVSWLAIDGNASLTDPYDIKERPDRYELNVSSNRFMRQTTELTKDRTWQFIVTAQ